MPKPSSHSLRQIFTQQQCGQSAALLLQTGESSMEPDLSLEPGLELVLHELRQLEPLIYAANDGKARAHFETLLAPGFWEVGASGKRYDRAFVLDVLEGRCERPSEESWEVTGLHVQAIAGQTYLFTYTLHQPTRDSRRATLWQRTANGWHMLYHQGTTVAQ